LLRKLRGPLGDVLRYLPAFFANIANGNDRQIPRDSRAGQGATATVYLCDDPDSARQVAVKVIQFGKDGGAMSRRMRKLFQNEGMVSKR
jgi:hypothetical protein